MKLGCRHLWSILPLLSVLPGLAQAVDEVYGTTEPFASEAIYFVLTDRFLDGDASNNHENQGQPNGTWQCRLDGPDGQAAFVGYLGGDFRGILDNADYIKEMGFTAVWVSPIVDNPDQAFTGGQPVQFGSGVGTDGGKTGYHGYWGVNFYQVDEHLESPGLNFAEFNQQMQDDHGLKVVLDIVANHGSPSWGMQPVDQPKFGEIYTEDGVLVADHQNLQPNQLDPNQPLHRWYNRSGNLAQLSDLNENNPEVLDYLAGAYLKWIDQGVDAFRIDTIVYMPHSFWKAFADRIRARHPGFYMFGENFNFDAGTIAQHQRPENGGISVLDFPGRSSITGMFENPGSDYRNIQGYLHLSDCVYTNPYDLATFYDNHDMTRMNATENGFIDAHNWLFTARGIPVVYYGSEMRFMHGKAEHQGNRNYFGPDNIAAARNSEVFKRLARIANIRRQSIALQKGLQENLSFEGHKAAFYRVYQHDGVNQTALVLLNKGDQAADFTIDQLVSAGAWRDAASGDSITVAPDTRVISTSVGAHDVKVLLLDAPVDHPQLVTRLQQTMKLLAGCRLPRVEVSPDPLSAGEQVTVGFRGAPDKQYALHWGINNWGGTSTPVSEDPMVFDQDRSMHGLAVTLPTVATQFDFVFHNLTDNTWDSNGGRDYHYQVTNTLTPPTPPTGLTATAGDASVMLQWQPVDNAASYTVYFTDDGNDPTTASGKQATEESRFNQTGLSNGVTYRYRVSASNANGESALSTGVQAVPAPAFRSILPQGSVLRLTGETFADWDPANDQYILSMVADHTWSGTLEVTSDLIQTPYKLTLNGSWTVNWGGGAAGRETQLPRGGANASVTLDPGTYTLKVMEGTSIDSALAVQWIGAGDPVLSVAPAEKSLALAQGSSATFDIQLSNTGGGELFVTGVSTDVTWLTASLNAGRVVASVDTGELAAGQTATGKVRVISNGGDKTITVQLTVSEPHPVVNVTFTCEKGETYLGQSVYVVGSIPELGAWKLKDAVLLGSGDYPIWIGGIDLPVDLDVEWKCVKREEKDPDKGVEWQSGQNNKLCTRPSCSRGYTASF